MPEPPPRLAPEQAKTAWELEAKTVAQHLGLPDDATAKLVKTYVEARHDQEEAIAKKRDELTAGRGGDEPGADEGDRPRGRRRGGAFVRQIAELNQAERQKLETGLKSFLSQDQVEKAMPALGSFHRGWDVMVSTVAGFGLDQGKQGAALDAIEKFVVATADARQPEERDDRQAMREHLRAAHETMMSSMESILSSDQMDQFTEIQRGGGRRFQGGRPGGDDGAAPPQRGARRGEGERLEAAIDGLDLTADQKTAVDKAVESYQKSLRDLFAKGLSGEVDREQAAKQHDDLRASFMSELEKTLTPEQVDQVKRALAPWGTTATRRRRAGLPLPTSHFHFSLDPERLPKALGVDLDQGLSPVEQEILRPGAAIAGEEGGLVLEHVRRSRRWRAAAGDGRRGRAGNPR